MRQLRPPETVAITLRGRQPHSFVFRDCWYEVEHAYGPWLAEGDWWQRESWQLEQWDFVARSSDNTLLYGCLVRNLNDESWQMVTLYD
jgi:protein ImuB